MTVTPNVVEVESLLKLWPLFLGVVSVIVWLVRIESRQTAMEEKIKLDEKINKMLKLIEQIKKDS